MLGRKFVARNRRINKFWSHIKKPYFEWGGNFYMTEKALNGEFEKLVIPV